MTLPAVTAAGHLPPGIHRGSLEEVQEVFGSGLHRRLLAERLGEAIRALESTGFVRAVYIDGCFLGPRPNPEDIDILATIEQPKHPGRSLIAERRDVLRDLRKAFKPSVEILFFDDGLKEVDLILDFFQEGCLKHGKCPKGIVELNR